MSSKDDTRKDPTLICSKCKRFEAKRTCDVCNQWMCLSCSRKTIFRYKNGYCGDKGYDYEYMKITRCNFCLTSVPQIQEIDKSDGCTIS